MIERHFYETGHRWYLAGSRSLSKPRENGSLNMEPVDINGLNLINEKLLRKTCWLSKRAVQIDKYLSRKIAYVVWGILDKFWLLKNPASTEICQ